jgi:hypothetical protein
VTVILDVVDSTMVELEGGAAAVRGLSTEELAAGCWPG